MLILFIRFPGHSRPQKQSTQPPSRKPDGEQTPKASEQLNQIKTNVRHHNIGQIYKLERRFIH
jgi:hypothetical protein